MSFLQVNDRIYDPIVAMIGKTSSGFDVCHLKNSLPSTLILYRPIRMKTYECVTDITRSSKMT